MTASTPIVGQAGQGFDQLGQFVLANQRVDGDEDAPARFQAVGVGGDFIEFGQGEILGLGPGGEFFQARDRSASAP